MNQSRNVAILIFDEVDVLDFCGPFSEKDMPKTSPKKKVTKVESI